MTDTEQVAVVEETVGSILDDHAQGTAARGSVRHADDYDRGLWKSLGSEFGLCAMHAPEALGGAGDLALAAAACRALGERLSSLPYIPTVALGTMPLLSAERTAAGEEVLQALLAGEQTATAVLEGDPTVEGGVASGRGSRVLHGASSDWVLIADRDRLVGVRRDDVTAAEPFASIDLTRPLADVDLRSAPCVELGRGPADLTAAMRRDLMTLLAHESAGGSRRVVAMAVDYARAREQFGRPIGSYQSIKHLCAELEIDAQAASAAAWAGTEAAGTPEHVAAARAAFLYTSEAFVRTATQSLHVHGGIGFTWEFDSHLYYRRAHATAVVLGRLSAIKRAYARELLAGRPRS